MILKGSMPSSMYKYTLGVAAANQLAFAMNKAITRNKSKFIA